MNEKYTLIWKYEYKIVIGSQFSVICYLQTYCVKNSSCFVHLKKIGEFGR